MPNFDCHSSTAIYSCCVYDVCNSILVILNDSCHGNPSCNHHALCHDSEICICLNAFPCRRLLILAVTVTVTVIVTVIVTETLIVTVVETESVTESVICVVSALRSYL
jgi:hypothetical protein